MSYTRAPRSASKKPPSSGSDLYKASNKPSTRSSSSSGEQRQSASSPSKRRSSADRTQGSRKPTASVPRQTSSMNTVSGPAGAAPKTGSAMTRVPPPKSTTSNVMPAGTAPSSVNAYSRAPPNNAASTGLNPAMRPNEAAPGGVPPSIQPIGGSMRVTSNGMYGPGAAGGFDIMGGPQNGMDGGGFMGPRPMSSYGSMGGNQNGMAGGFSLAGENQGGMGGYGSMAGGSLDGANGMGGGMGSMYGAGGPMGSMYNAGGPMGSMYNAGGPMESMYNAGGPMGSMYNAGGPMGSMYGMGGPMGSMYGAGGPMGSMYGMGGMGSMYGMGGMGSMYGMGGMGSMYGMGGPMGSMYGMGGMGSIYGGTSRSLIDAASRRDSFLNRNDLIRADVKPLSSDKGDDGEKDAKTNDKKKSKGLGDKAEQTKDDAEDPKAAKKEVTDKKASAGVKPTEKDIKNGVKKESDKESEKKDSDKKESDKELDKKESEKKESEKKESEKKESEKKESEKKESEKKESEQKESDKKESDKKGSEAPVAASQNPLKFSGTKIRSLALVYKSGKEAKVTVKGRDIVSMEKETKLDETILIEDATKPVEAAALSEVRNQWVMGHNATIMIGCDATRRTEAVNFMCEYLSTCTGKLAASSEYFSIYVTMTALEGADKGRDLLKDAATAEKLALASSPVYGPALNDMTTKEVDTKEKMDAVLKEGMERAKDAEIVCSYLVLKQCRKSSAGRMVYLSSLNVTFVGPHVEHLIGLKAKKPEEPCRLYRYSVGGGSHTMCIGFVSDDDASAAKVLDALKEMREVENTEPRSGNVKRFIEYTKKEIPKCREKVSSTTDNSKKADYETMLKRMEMMLKDAEEMEKDPKTVAPKAYV